MYCLTPIFSNFDRDDSKPETIVAAIADCTINLNDRADF